MLKWCVRLVWYGLLLCCLPTRLSAQSETLLKAEYEGHQYYLSGFWASNKLRFDSAGHLQGSAKPTSITLSGFDISKVELRSNTLILDGKRVGLKVHNNKVEYVDLSDRIRLEIASPNTGTYADRLPTILSAHIDTLIPKIPPEMQAAAWRLFADKTNDTQLSHGSNAAASSSPVYELGGAIKPPALLHQVDPRYSDAALKLKLNADVLVRCHVEKDGTTSHLELVDAAGMGLDEQALYAVSQYIFFPATIQKTPVAVELKVAVAFRIMQ